MPGLVALPLERLVLVIAADCIHKNLDINAMFDIVQPAIRFESHYFTGAESAFDRLTNGSAQLPAPSAEWAARHAR